MKFVKQAVLIFLYSSKVRKPSSKVRRGRKLSVLNSVEKFLWFNHRSSSCPTLRLCVIRRSNSRNWKADVEGKLMEMSIAENFLREILFRESLLEIIGFGVASILAQSRHSCAVNFQVSFEEHVRWNIKTQRSPGNGGRIARFASMKLELGLIIFG